MPYNELRRVTANLLERVVTDVSLKPGLHSLTCTGASLLYWTAITDEQTGFGVRLVECVGWTIRTCI